MEATNSVDSLLFLGRASEGPFPVTDLSRLANIAEILSAVIVFGGILFAVIQMRQTRQQRRELAAIELFSVIWKRGVCQCLPQCTALP